MNMFISVSAFVLATAQLIFLVNFFISIFAGKTREGEQSVACDDAGMGNTLSDGTWKFRRRAADRSSLGL